MTEITLPAKGLSGTEPHSFWYQALAPLAWKGQAAKGLCSIVRLPTRHWLSRMSGLMAREDDLMVVSIVVCTSNMASKRSDRDSYWWDAPCIPEEHQLRKQAIMNNINQTLAASKVTLICDRDLMDISISDLSIQTKETILAMFLVCDQNVRAWTYLESMRGRNQIQILCKNNATIHFEELVKDILQNGAVDLANLILTVPHALPQTVSGKLTQADEARGITYIEYLDLERAGSFLSHRPASRPGDDVVIWKSSYGREVARYRRNNFGGTRDSHSPGFYRPVLHVWICQVHPGRLHPPIVIQFLCWELIRACYPITTQLPHGRGRPNHFQGPVGTLDALRIYSPQAETR